MCITKNYSRKTTSMRACGTESHFFSKVQQKNSQIKLILFDQIQI